MSTRLAFAKKLLGFGELAISGHHLLCVLTVMR
jgi:hypothetical protein